MTRIEKLEKEIQELRLEVARLEGRVHELSIHHVPLQPRIPKVQPWDLPNFKIGGPGDALCQKNMVRDTPCFCKQCNDFRKGLSGLIIYTTGSNTISVPCSTPSASTGFPLKTTIETFGEFPRHNTTMEADRSLGHVPLFSEMQTNTMRLRATPPKGFVGPITKKTIVEAERGKPTFNFEEEDFKID